ncbi:MAG: hypothetical protein HYV06_03660 [Deltaproteobacteria bacterium]|nr:hypothetical protein [Deltaproteobacteria bacterium]
MTNLLLITDVPRLRKVFARLKEEKDIRLRIVNSLEKGGEEIVADKPDLVFVQTHLSGLSADILLMHLKKQLGRRRAKFVLLSPPDQIGEEVIRLYQGHLETSLDDHSLFDAIREVISTLAAKGKKGAPATADSAATRQAPDQVNDTAAVQQQVAATQSEVPLPPALPQIPGGVEPSLEEQGITYTPRPRLSVYSEFTSSFDSAVGSMQPPEPVSDSPLPQPHAWEHEEVETIEARPSRSRRTTFLFWLAPLLVAVIAITLLQHRRSRPAAVAPQQPGTTSLPANQAAGAVPAAVGTLPVPAPSTLQKPGAQPPAAGADARLSDQAVLSAIAENRARKEPARPATAAARLTNLPEFIPRTGLDKGYGAANPGWERYKGRVTEFKVYREATTIKAIQIIDRGGEGVPESFMKGVLRQVSQNPVLVVESSDKKEGYVIQRGQVAQNLKAVYYRDEKGGRLRAFVLTWE